mmetsp:Transcript_12525/g.34916  ORF Transcript_12525/g.34916 Transcript_12525/m.34916 type:complete len:280 (+) Transcript_12525:2911-3750(+)
MVWDVEEVVLREDSSVVSLELVSDVNTARDGSSLHDLHLELVLLAQQVALDILVRSGKDVSVRVNRPAGVVLDWGASSWQEWLWWSTWVAGLADSVRVTLSINSLVVLASLVRDTVLSDALVRLVGVAALARSAITAVHHDLRGKDHLRVSSLLGNLDTVGQGRRRSHGPARTTVLWNVLVPGLGQEVRSVHVAPEEVGRDVSHRHELLWPWTDDLLSVLEVGSKGTTFVQRTTLSHVGVHGVSRGQDRREDNQGHDSFLHGHLGSRSGVRSSLGAELF